MFDINIIVTPEDWMARTAKMDFSITIDQDVSAYGLKAAVDSAILDAFAFSR